MPKITADFKDITVSDLRKNLARLVSKIKGDLKVSYASFSLTVEMPKRELPSFPKGD